MDKLPGLIITVVLAALVFTLIIRSWRRRLRRDATLLVSDPELVLDAPLWQGTVGYVASAPAEQPLDRLTPAGLAYRGDAELVIARNGLRLHVGGEVPVLIPAERVENVREAAWAIDRGVGPAGLVALRWHSRADESGGAVAIDSYLRVQDHAERARLVDALAQLATSTPLDSSTSPRENA